MKLEDTLAKKKDELMQVRDDSLSVQKAVIEKDSFFQETNTLLLEQISKTSSESKQNEVIGSDKELEKGIEITSPKTTSDSPYYLFFQQYGIIIVIVLLVIFIIWRIFRDGKVLGPGPKDLVLGPSLQIFRSRFRTDEKLVLKSPSQ